MKRVNYHLPEDQLARVQELAYRLGITAAELIRRALDREIAANLSLLETPENPRMATAKTARRATLSEAQKYIIEASRLGRVSEVQRIALDKITDDHTYQSREKIDTNYIHSELRPLLEQYGDLEPIVLFKEYGSERLFIGNGFHRYELYKMARRNEPPEKQDIPAIIIDAGQDWERELRLYSASANLKFSKAPTREDKIKALYMLFADNECWSWPDRDLAKRVGLSDGATKMLRRRFSQESGKTIPERVKVALKSGKTAWYPYGIPGNTPGFTPNVRLKNKKTKNYRVKSGGKTFDFHASNDEAAKQKAEAIAAKQRETKKTERSKRVSLRSASGLRQWFELRMLPVSHGCSLGVSLFRSEKAWFVILDEFSREKLSLVTGAILFAWKEAGFPSVDLAICGYFSEATNAQHRLMMETLSAPGLFQIHFLTPEEIVQRYAPQEGQTDQGGNGFQGDEA